MCIAIAGKIVEINSSHCLVDVMGIIKSVSIELVRDVAVGDHVLIHAGCAIQKIDQQEALDTIQLFKELTELMKQ